MEEKPDELYNSIIPTVATVAALREAYFLDEDNLQKAKEYADELYSFYLENDDEQVLSRTKRELERLHKKFPCDLAIAEHYASCLYNWAYCKRKTTLDKAKKGLCLLRCTFPESEEIAEDYTSILVLLSEVETSADTCLAFLQEIEAIRKHFVSNSEIKENYEELQFTLNRIQEYRVLLQKAQRLKEDYLNDSSQDKAANYARALGSLIELEIDLDKCQDYTETIKGLIKKFPDCKELVELKVGALYDLAAGQNYEEMRKASREIHRLLKQHPNNEKIAEYYVLSLDYISEDADNLAPLACKIKKYHQLYPNNSTITSSYAGVLSILVEEQSTRKKEETLDTIWALFLQHPEMEEISECYIDAFTRYKGENILFCYSSWLKKPVLKIDKKTGEVVSEYETAIIACQAAKITPINMFHETTNNVYSDDVYDWYLIQ